MKFWSEFDEIHTVCGLRDSCCLNWFFWAPVFFSFGCTRFNCIITKLNLFSLQGFKRAHDICVCWLCFFVRFKLRIIFQYGWYHRSKVRMKKNTSFEQKKLPHKLWCEIWTLTLRPNPATRKKLEYKNNDELKSFPDVYLHWFSSVKIDKKELISFVFFYWHEIFWLVAFRLFFFHSLIFIDEVMQYSHFIRTQRIYSANIYFPINSNISMIETVMYYVMVLKRLNHIPNKSPKYFLVEKVCACVVGRDFSFT